MRIDKIESDYHEGDTGNALSGAAAIIALAVLLFLVGWGLIVVVTS